MSASEWVYNWVKDPFKGMNKPEMDELCFAFETMVAVNRMVK